MRQVSSLILSLCEITFPTRRFNDFFRCFALSGVGFSAEVCEGSSALPVLTTMPLTSSQGRISAFLSFHSPAAAPSTLHLHPCGPREHTCPSALDCHSPKPFDETYSLQMRYTVLSSYASQEQYFKTSS